MHALSLGARTWIKVKSAFVRITLTRVSAAFFLFSFIHCFAQGIIQAFLYSVDSERSNLISSILTNAHVPSDQLVWLTTNNNGYQLQVCSDIPLGQSPSPCSLVFDTRNSSFYGASVGSSLDSQAFDGENNTFALLEPQCTYILMYADDVLKNSKREDLTLISVQFWLFAISFIAIMYDSIPHTLAVFGARVLVTVWSSYTIWRTTFIEDVFNRLIMDPDTPCHLNLFLSYSASRTKFEIPDLILNCSALFLSAVLSWRLLKAYKTHSFKSLGAPPKIIRIYKYFMALLVCLQLSVFILVTAMALWVNELTNTAISRISTHTVVYKGVFIFTTVLLIPWLTMGWYSIRYEKKRLVTVFLIVDLLFLSAWATMFYSQVYRWTFLRWTFFASLTVASFVVLIASIILGTKCWLSFGQGLSHYLYAEDALASSDFAPEVFPHNVDKKDPFDEDLAVDTIRYAYDMRTSV